MTPAEIESATFRFVAQHLNHCATAVPTLNGVEKDVRRSVWNLPVFGLRVGLLDVDTAYTELIKL